MFSFFSPPTKSTAVEPWCRNVIPLCNYHLHIPWFEDGTAGCLPWFILLVYHTPCMLNMHVISILSAPLWSYIICNYLTLKHCQFWIGYLLQWLICFWHFVCLATILLTQTDAMCSFLLLKQPQWKTYHAYIPGWRYKRFIRLKLWNAGSLREHNESFCV